MYRKQKENIVTTLTEDFNRTTCTYIVDYQGLNVEQMNNLRREFDKEAVVFRVVKNTLARRAFENTDVAKLAEFFIGPTAIAISDTDPIAPAKVLAKVKKDYEKLQVKAILVEGQQYDVENLIQLSKMPGREELLSKLIGVMQGPLAKFVGVMRGPMQKFVGVLKAIEEKNKDSEENKTE